MINSDLMRKKVTSDDEEINNADILNLLSPYVDFYSIVQYLLVYRKLVMATCGELVASAVHVWRLFFSTYHIRSSPNHHLWSSIPMTSGLQYQSPQVVKR
jgi:hypothetical protein